MSVNKILIHTQYEENYAAHDWNGEGECPQAWKPKGGHVFQIKMDADLLMYSDGAIVFAKMLEGQNTDYERYTYLDHEIQYGEPSPLGDQSDYVEANQSLNAESV
jgi:hypothetical protein